MEPVNVQEAKERFSNLIEAVEKGEEIIISRSGEPVARLVPFQKISGPRRPGSAKGKFTVPPEFFDPLPEEIMDAFEK
ncbi:MAG: type II toxin-antitoxin system Phd/YefM family antitoxin [Desulfococcaceae bacterium]